MSDLDRLVEGVREFGAHVVYFPNATYPIVIRGLGGRTVDDVRRLRDELTEVLKFIADGGQQ